MGPGRRSSDYQKPEVERQGNKSLTNSNITHITTVSNATQTVLIKNRQQMSVSYLKGLHPLLLLDERDPEVRLLDDVLALELVDHARLVHEIAVSTQHLKWTTASHSSVLLCKPGEAAFSYIIIIIRS